MSGSDVAGQYDKAVSEYNSFGHDVIFGMGFEFVRSGEKLLDIGIGTGLASRHFFDIGLKIYGIDASQEMLDVCQSKSFTEELRQCDIAKAPLPYDDQYFSHVICCGVLHFLEDLFFLFTEARRVMRTGGIFGFTVAPQETRADSIKEETAWGIPMFRHSTRYILKLLEANSMAVLKEQRLLTKGADKADFNMLFSAFIAKK